MEMKRLASPSNFRDVESEWKYEFTNYVLTLLELPEELIEECFPVFEDFNLEHKIKLREYLDKFNIKIIDDLDGGLKFFVEQELIAEWKKCSFKRCVDNSAVDPKDRIYIEIVTEPWTIFNQIEG